MIMQRFRKRFIAYMCIALMFIPCIQGVAEYTGVTVYAAEQSGKITGNNVNVRQGAGTSYDYVRDSDGNKVQLDIGHEVTILANKKASDGATWYNVSFYFGGTSYKGYVHGDYVSITKEVEYEEDADFAEYLEKQGFPAGYWDGLMRLHAMYPKWTFVAEHVNYEWSDVLKNQSLVGRSLVPVDSISSWKSTDPTAYDSLSGKWYGFDGASWVAASEELVAYCLDPRNFLDEISIFQFEKLAYDDDLHTLDGIKSIVKSTFMESTLISDDAGGKLSYAQALLNTAQVTGASPYHLASRIIQEMGTQGGSRSISGAVPGYENVYNYYNQGAYAHDGRDAITNGLIYAKSQGWTTRYKAIMGGAAHISKSYISIGQNTLYYQKFDLVGTPYEHQYMTNILAPASESVNVAKGYTDEMKEELNLVFVIPVYKNMPEFPVQKPTGDGSPNNVLKSLSVSGYSLTPTFTRYEDTYSLVVGEDVSTATISASAIDSDAKISGTGKVKLEKGDNLFEIKVTAANGSVKKYSLYIYRGGTPVMSFGHEDGPIEPGEEETTEDPKVEPKDTEYKITTEYDLDEDNKYISGVTVGSNAVEVLAKIKTSEGEAYVLNEDGTINSGKVSTGNQLLCVDKNGKETARYTFVLYGDVDGNGDIDLYDLLYVKRHVTEVKALSGVYLEAADADKAGDGATIMDMLYIKREMLSIAKIEQ